MSNKHFNFTLAEIDEFYQMSKITTARSTTKPVTFHGWTLHAKDGRGELHVPYHCDGLMHTRVTVLWEMADNDDE